MLAMREVKQSVEDEVAVKVGTLASEEKSVVKADVSGCPSKPLIIDEMQLEEGEIRAGY